MDETVLEPRLEGLLHFPKRTPPPPGSKRPTFGILASVFGSKRTGLNMAYNAALGPTLHPHGRPREVLVALLATMSDFTDANDRDLELRDIFAVRLYLAIPLTGF